MAAGDFFLMAARHWKVCCFSCFVLTVFYLFFMAARRLERGFFFFFFLLFYFFLMAARHWKVRFVIECLCMCVFKCQ